MSALARYRPGISQEKRTRFLLVIALSARGLSALAQLGLVALVGHSLGAAAVGLFFVYWSWSRVGTVILTLGLPAYFVRKAATTEPAAFRSSFRGTTVRLLTVGVVACGLVLAASVALRLPVLLTSAVCLSSLGFALVRLGAGSMSGLGHPGAGQSLEFGAIPATTVVLLLILRDISANELILVHAGVTLALGLTLVYFVSAGRVPRRRLSNDEQLTDDARLPTPRDVLNFSTLAFTDVAMLAIPVLLLSAFANDSAVGLFAVATRSVAFAMLILSSLGSYFAPRFAQAWHSGQLHYLFLLRRRAQALAIAIYSPALIVFLAWPSEVLSIFGADLSQGGTALRVLAIGQLVNAMVGLSGEYLVMTGHERFQVLASFASLLSFLLLVFAAVPAHGADGMAIAFATSLVVGNLLSYGFGVRLSRCALRGKTVGIPMTNRRSAIRRRQAPPKASPESIDIPHPGRLNDLL